ncbi:hypothetical protein LDENG_00215160, partial [Lucifuga dentata]
RTSSLAPCVHWSAAMRLSCRSTSSCISRSSTQLKERRSTNVPCVPQSVTTASRCRSMWKCI